MPDETKAPAEPPTVREKQADALDNGLLKMLTKGVTVMNKDGRAVKIAAPHQIWEIARKRQADLGLTKEVNPESDAAKLVAELNLPKNRNIHDMPGVSAEPDAATG